MGRSRLYTTEEAAAKVGISRPTLQRWIKARKLRPPKATFEGLRGKRLWSESDLARLRKTKEKIFKKGKRRPRKTK